MDKLSRREFGSLAPAVASVTAAGPAQGQAPSGTRSAGQRPSPNIVLITTDHMRVDNIGENAGPHMLTPVMDRLARGGVTFTMCNTVGVACAPNRASLMTGRYPHSHGVMNNGIKMPEDEVTLTHVLRENGYYTGQMGKLHFWPHSARNHRGYHPPYGFHQMRLSDEPGCYDDAYGLWLNAQGPEVRRKANVRMPPASLKFARRRPEAHNPPEPVHGLSFYTFEGDERTTHAHFVANETVGFIEECAGRPDEPFFVHAGFYAPHPPLNPPASQLALYKDRDLPPRKYRADEADYLPESIARRMRQLARIPENIWDTYRRHFYAMVSNIDQNVGRIMDALERTGAAENTIFILTSDHGDYLGDHNLNGKSALPFDGAMVIPLVIQGPGIPQGKRSDELVEIVDVMPTVLEMLGIPLPTGNQGISLLPAMEGGKAREIAFMTGLSNRIVRTREAMYSYWKNGDEVLFDLERDPDQFRSVAQVSRAKPLLDEMRMRMLRHEIEVQDTLPERVAAY